MKINKSWNCYYCSIFVLPTHLPPNLTPSPSSFIETVLRESKENRSPALLLLLKETLRLFWLWVDSSRPGSESVRDEVENWSAHNSQLGEEMPEYYYYYQCWVLTYKNTSGWVETSSSRLRSCSPGFHRSEVSLLPTEFPSSSTSFQLRPTPLNPGQLNCVSVSVWVCPAIIISSGLPGNGTFHWLQNGMIKKGFGFVNGNWVE